MKRTEAIAVLTSAFRALPNRCPECGSADKFYHCHERCHAPTHAVTCNRCKTPYLTTQKPEKSETGHE